MSTRNGPEALARSIGSAARNAAGMIRRMIVTRTRSALYQIAGHRLLDGSTETRDAEVFSGVGFTARPTDTDDTEAIVVFPGGSSNPVIVATRQEAVRRSIGGDLAADETQIHNSVTLVRIKADGTVEIRSKGGTAVQLATLADIQALRTTFNTHLHAIAGITAGSAGVTSAVPTTPAVAPSGTSKLKAE